MKNTLVDLNNSLFAEMERLGDEDLTDEQLKREISRSKAMTDVAGKIIENAKLELDAVKLTVEYGGPSRKEIGLPPMLELKKDAKRDL